MAIAFWNACSRRWSASAASGGGAPSEAYAQRFAAKEACAKALGTGFRHGVTWRDIEVGNLPSGQPVLTLSNGAAARLSLLTPAGMAADLHVSMTDEYPYAQAMVVISAVDRPAGADAPPASA